MKAFSDVRLAGIDFSTRAVDVVILPYHDPSGLPVWRRLEVDQPGENDDLRAFLAARRLGSRLASAIDWTDVQWVFVERPMSVGMKAHAALMRMQGAIVNSIPSHIDGVWETEPQEWKARLTDNANASKEHVREACRVLGFDPAEDAPQDAYDAFGIAWALRALLRDGDAIGRAHEHLADAAALGVRTR